MRILLLEDEDFMARHVLSSLQGIADELETEHVTTCREALERALAKPYDCLILDRNVDDGDGLGVLSQLRARGVRSPAIILSNLNAIEQRIDGLDGGADDYLGKDFEPRELHARIRAAMRRAGQEGHPLILKRGDLELHRAARKASWRGEDLALEPLQFDMLLSIATPWPDAVSYQQIWRDAWPKLQGLEPQKQPMHTTLSRLRSKMRKLDVTAEIVSVEGGYRLEPNT